jgi:hypothetical protein
MALKIPPPSKEATQALSALADFLRPGDPSPTDRVRPVGQPFFTVGLEQLANGEEILPAAPTGWRFLIRGEYGQAVAADVNTRSGVKPKMSSLWRGAQIQKVAEAIDELEKLPEVEKQDYELRILRIPGLHIEAFWLRSPAGGPVLVVPFLGLAEELQLMRPYPAEEFRQIVQRMAKQHLEDSEEAGE